MEITLIQFIGCSSILAAVLVGLLKKYIKEYIMPRWGDLGVQLLLLIIAVILAFLGYLWGKFPENITTTIFTIFATAMALYQVLVKAVWQKAINNELDNDEK